MIGCSAFDPLEDDPEVVPGVVPDVEDEADGPCGAMVVTPGPEPWINCCTCATEGA